MKQCRFELALDEKPNSNSDTNGGKTSRGSDVRLPSASARMYANFHASTVHLVIRSDIYIVDIS